MSFRGEITAALGDRIGRRLRPMAVALSAALVLAAGGAAAAADTDGDGVSDPVDNCVSAKNASQIDSDGDQFGNACDADLNDDGIVNFADLARMKVVFFKRDPNADLNGDGIVNFTDLAILKGSFFKPPGPSGLLPAVLPVFEVTKEGLTQDEAKRLGAAFGLDAVRGEGGSLSFVSDRLGDVPMLEPRAAAGAGVPTLPGDEDGQETHARAFDLDAIAKITPLGDRTARAILEGKFEQADVKLPGNPEERSLHVGHTMLNLRSLSGDTALSQPIDTFVRLDFTLAGRPLVGPGAKARVSFSPAGEVTGLGFATREMQEGDLAPLASPFDARRECARHYPDGSKLRTPRLVYFAPDLDRRVQTVFPHWECRGKGPSGEELVPAVLPAVIDVAPVATIEAEVLQGSHVRGEVHVKGGTPPYSYSWQSLTTDLSDEASGGPSLAYDVAPRMPVSKEMLAVTVADANGLTGKARVTLDVNASAVLAAATPAAVQRTNRLDVGGEFNVYEWNCVKQSAAGFSAVFGAQGVPVQFRWTGTNAWERDFRETSAPQNGDDASYVDDVDLAWYTGHGSPGSFTFDNPNHDDGDIVPGDGRWGNRDLEWLQLESCNVLQFDSGGVPIWDRWANVFDRLHLLNGFQTTASCVDTPSGTAGRFSRYLFPRTIFIVVIPALKVRQAWAQMAYDLEPSGRQFVTMGAAAAGWVTNYDDYFWGQGPVGPDIPKSQIIGYWWLMGEV